MGKFDEKGVEYVQKIFSKGISLIGFSHEDYISTIATICFLHFRTILQEIVNQEKEKQIKNLKTHHFNAHLENSWKADVIITWSHQQHTCLNLEKSSRWGLKSCHWWICCQYLQVSSASLGRVLWEKANKVLWNLPKIQEKEGSRFL